MDQQKRKLGNLDDLISRLDSVPKRPNLDLSFRLGEVQQHELQQIAYYRKQKELKPVDAAKSTIRRQMQRSGDSDDPEKSIEATLGEKGELSSPPPPSENDESVRKFVRLANNKVIPMSEYCTMMRQNQQAVPSKKVAPSTPPQTLPNQKDVRKREIPTMLVMPQSGEQRENNIQCISKPVVDIDYLVTVGISNAGSTQLLTAAVMPFLKSTLAKQQPPPKYVRRLPAVCNYCGCFSWDHAHCQRCKSPILGGGYKSVPTSSQQQPITPGVVKGKASDQLDKVKSPELLAKQQPPPKYVRRLPAVCNYCGCFSWDHAHCQRCKSPILGGGYKSVSTSSQQQPITHGVVKGKASDQLDKAKLELKRQQATEMEKKEGGNDASKNGKKTPLPGKEMAPLKFEPTVTEEMKAAKVVVRRDVTKVTQVLKFMCRTIQIGSHKYEPTKKVVITANGIQIVAPNVQRPNKQVKLNIQAGELYRMIYHFSKTISVIFLHTVPSCGVYIRESLGMGLPSDQLPYYDPLSGKGHFKRIVLVLGTAPEIIDRQLKEMIKNGKLEEINLADAKELLWCSVPRVAEPSRR